jgi:hypothetical protein
MNEHLICPSEFQELNDAILNLKPSVIPNYKNLINIIY